MYIYRELDFGLMPDLTYKNRFIYMTSQTIKLSINKSRVSVSLNTVMLSALHGKEACL